MAVFLKKDGGIGLDGSAFNIMFPEIAYAGSAAVQTDTQGNIIAYIAVALQTAIPQNSAMAEQEAAVIAINERESKAPQPQLTVIPPSPTHTTPSRPQPIPRLPQASGGNSKKSVTTHFARCKPTDQKSRP